MSSIASSPVAFLDKHRQTLDRLRLEREWERASLKGDRNFGDGLRRASPEPRAPENESYARLSARLGSMYADWRAEHSAREREGTEMRDEISALRTLVQQQQAIIGRQRERSRSPTRELVLVRHDPYVDAMGAGRPTRYEPVDLPSLREHEDALVRLQNTLREGANYRDGSPNRSFSRDPSPYVGPDDYAAPVRHYLPLASAGFVDRYESPPKRYEYGPPVMSPPPQPYEVLRQEMILPPMGPPNPYVNGHAGTAPSPTAPVPARSPMNGHQEATTHSPQQQDSFTAHSPHSLTVPSPTHHGGHHHHPPLGFSTLLASIHAAAQQGGSPVVVVMPPTPSTWTPGTHTEGFPASPSAPASGSPSAAQRSPSVSEGKPAKLANADLPNDGVPPPRALMRPASPPLQQLSTAKASGVAVEVANDASAPLSPLRSPRSTNHRAGDTPLSQTQSHPAIPPIATPPSAPSAASPRGKSPAPKTPVPDSPAAPSSRRSSTDSDTSSFEERYKVLIEELEEYRKSSGDTQKRCAELEKRCAELEDVRKRGAQQEKQIAELTSKIKSDEDARKAAHKSGEEEVTKVKREHNKEVRRLQTENATLRDHIRILQADLGRFSPAPAPTAPPPAAHSMGSPFPISPGGSSSEDVDDEEETDTESQRRAAQASRDAALRRARDEDEAMQREERSRAPASAPAPSAPLTRQVSASRFGSSILGTIAEQETDSDNDSLRRAGSSETFSTHHKSQRRLSMHQSTRVRVEAAVLMLNGGERGKLSKESMRRIMLHLSPDEPAEAEANADQYTLQGPVAFDVVVTELMNLVEEQGKEVIEALERGARRVSRSACSSSSDDGESSVMTEDDRRTSGKSTPRTPRTVGKKELQDKFAPKVMDEVLRPLSSMSPSEALMECVIRLDIDRDGLFNRSELMRVMLLLGMEKDEADEQVSAQLANGPVSRDNVYRDLEQLMDDEGNDVIQALNLDERLGVALEGMDGDQTGTYDRDEVARLLMRFDYSLEAAEQEADHFTVDGAITFDAMRRNFKEMIIRKGVYILETLEEYGRKDESAENLDASSRALNAYHLK